VKKKTSEKKRQKKKQTDPKIEGGPVNMHNGANESKKAASAAS